MTIRRAIISDVPHIVDLIQPYVDDGVLLPVPAYRLYERIRDFIVAEEDGAIVGCGSLMIMWHDLVEIRSLAVQKGYQGGGVGRRVVETLIEEARELGIAKVFALTYQTKFFGKLGFRVVEKETLPHKIWKDCVHCSKFTHCDEISMVLELAANPDGPAPSLPLPAHVLNIEPAPR